MEVATAIMTAIVIAALAAFVALTIGGAKEEERKVTGFSRIDRSVGAKLELMASILRKLLLTPSAIIIVLTLTVALAGMAVLGSESRVQGTFVVPTIRAEDSMTLIKLVNAVPVDEALNATRTLLSNATGPYIILGVYLVEVVDEPIRVEGVRTPKIVVVGVDDCCHNTYLIRCEALDSPNPPFACVNEDEFRTYLYVDGELPVIPIEAFIGNRPVFPPLTSVIVTSLNGASQLLGYEEPMANVVLVSGYVPPSIAGKSLGKLVSEIWVVSEDGALILTSETVSSLKEVMLATLLSVSMAVVVSSAARSMSPQVVEVANKLMISGFPSWGGAIIYYVAIVLCSIAATAIYSVTAVMLDLPTGVGHLILMGAFALTVMAHTPRASGHISIGEAEADYLSMKIDRCTIDEILGDVVSAIKRTEFFVIEELTVKRSDNKAFVRSKSIFSETWGIGVDIEVLISPAGGGSCRVEVRASDWSIEEISASLTKSVRALALSRIRSVIELWRLGYSC